jgi:hypothetical protein
MGAESKEPDNAFCNHAASGSSTETFIRERLDVAIMIAALPVLDVAQRCNDRSTSFDALCTVRSARDEAH